MRRPASSICLALLLLLPVALVPLAAQAQTGQETLASFESGGWRYKVVANGALEGFQAKGYDDSGFSLGTGAFGSGGNCPLQETVATDWPINNDLLVRRTFDLPAGATGIQITGGVDNSLDVYWNGIQVGERYNQEFCTTLSSFSYSVPDSLVTAGKNVLAVRAGDHGIESFLDLQVTGTPGTPCESTLTDGYFEPTQGVWQDDAVLPGTSGPDVDAFANAPGKQLEKLAPLADEIRYEAQLGMVKGKKSLLFGIHYAEPEPTPIDRFNIVYTVTTNCTVNARTRLRFTLLQGPSTTTIGTSENLGEYKLTGPAGATSEFEVVMAVPQGFPDKAFKFPSTGDYLIRGELFLPSSGPTGLKVDVTGEVVETMASRVLFLPVVINDRSDAKKATLLRLVNKMALASYRHIPDMYPLKQRGFPIARGDTQDLSSFSRQALEEWVTWLQQLSDFSQTGLFSQVRLAAVDSRFASVAQMATGTGRVVAVFSGRDFNSLLPRSLRGRVGGFTSSSKFIGLPSDAPWEVVAHEYAHSVPEFLWSKNEMLAECGIDYHNKIVTLESGAQVPLKIAHGYQITNGPDEEVRILHDPEVSIMGPGGNWDPWMDQCTYWHLLKVLQEPIDPPTLVVSGRLARSETAEIGELFPMYQMDGVVDLAAGTEGEWAFVLKDVAGAELGRYPFEPQWSLDDETITRDLLSFSFRLPDLDETASIELVGPQGVLDTSTVSANAPVVSIVKPADGARARVRDGKVKVVWAGSDADDDELLYTVTYSSDRGATWEVLRLEVPGTALRLKVGNKTMHMVRVTATDGVNSSTDEVTFTTPKR